MKNTKKAVIAALCAVALVLTTFLGTMAYLTSKDSVTNTFTVGRVYIDLDEAPVDKSGKETTGTRVKANEYHLIPGQKYDKDPTIHVAANSENAWIFVKVDNQLAGKAEYNNREFSGILTDNNIESQITTNGWKDLEGVDGVYYKEYTKTDSVVNYVVFENFTVDGNKADNDAIKAYGDKKIVVTGYAIQNEGFDTAAAAWTQIASEYDVDAPVTPPSEDNEDNENVTSVRFVKKVDVPTDAVPQETNLGDGISVLKAGSTLYISSANKIGLPTDSSNLFRWCSNLTSIDFSNADTSGITNMNNMFYYCSNLTDITFGSNFNTSEVTNMYQMFGGCSSLTSLDISSFDTSNVTDMSSMFSGCSSLTGLDISSFDTSNVTDMERMFNSCSSLTSLDLSKFNTSGVTNMSNMFYGCNGLTNITFGDNFNTSNVTDMNNMFNSCSSLTSLDLSKFKTSGVTNMRDMFSYCKGLTSLDLSSFDTSNVTNMSEMFYYCSKLTTIYASDSFKTDNVTNSSNMFFYSFNLKGGNGTEYDSNVTNWIYARIDGGPSNPGYFTAKPTNQ